MKTLIAILAFGLISCVQTTTADKNVVNDSIRNEDKNGQIKTSDSKVSSSNVYASYIDNRLKSYLDTAFKGWILPEANRWDTLWFNQYKSKDNLVNYVKGDFDCNKKEDYALLFKKSDGALAAYAFLSNGQSFQSYQLFDFGKDTGGLIEFGLELLPPGKHNYMDPESDEAPSVIINCNAIQVLNFEKGAETFYWEKGKLKSIMTGD